MLAGLLAGGATGIGLRNLDVNALLSALASVAACAAAVGVGGWRRGHHPADVGVAVVTTVAVGLLLGVIAVFFALAALGNALGD